MFDPCTACPHGNKLELKESPTSPWKYDVENMPIKKTLLLNSKVYGFITGTAYKENEKIWIEDCFGEGFGIKIEDILAYAEIT